MKFFRSLPCLACADWRRDRCLTVIGAVFLALQRGEKFKTPTVEDALRGCCKNAYDHSFTFKIRDAIQKARYGF
jgi:hypothetical protein